MQAKGSRVSSEIEWRWADPQGQQRLVRIDELRAALAGGVIAPNTPVWRSGWVDWKPAYDVPELTASTSANGAVLNIPPPPLFIVAVQHEYEDHGASLEPPASHIEPPPPPRYVPSAAPPVAVPPPVAVSSAPSPAAPSPAPLPVAPSPSPSPVAQNQVALFRAVPSPPAPPAKTSSSSHLKAALPQPQTLSGFAEPASPPVSLPHSASPPAIPPAAPSAFPPPDSSWDDKDEDDENDEDDEKNDKADQDGKEAKSAADDSKDAHDDPARPEVEPAVPAPAPSETLAGARLPVHVGVGLDANTAVDMAKLTPADAERILAGGPSHPTVIGVPVLAQPVLPPPPPMRQSSTPPTLVQAGGRFRTPNFGAAPKPSSPPKGSSQPPRRTTQPPPLRKRGHTLMLYGGAPQPADAVDVKPSDAPPINVPAPGAQAPKAVTQAPPWIDDAKADSSVPKLAPPGLPKIRPMMDSIEEISGSVILAEDSGADVTARRQKIEDLSGSHLLPDASGEAPQMPAAPPPSHAPAGSLREPALDLRPPPVGPSGTLHAEPAPAPAAVTFPTEPTTLPAMGVVPPLGAPVEDADNELSSPLAPAASPTGRIVHDLNEIWKQPRQRRMLLTVGGGGVGLLAVFALVIKLATGPRSVEATSAGSTAVTAVAAQPPAVDSPGARNPSAGGKATTAAPVADEPATALVPAPPSLPSTAPCALVGAAHVVAPKAQVRTGVETVATQNRLALGFATGEKDGLAVALDPASLAAISTSKQHSHEPIRRLLPLVLAGRSVVAVADADRKWERIAGARTVPGEGTLVLGSVDGKLVWGARPTDTPHPLWPLEGEGAVEALRAVPLDDGGLVVAFRQGTAIYLGTLGADKVPIGGLSKIAGLGPQIGSPALGAVGTTAMAVWADRAGTGDPWMLRFVRWHPGQAPGDAQAFAIPPGGMGEQAMSPGVTGVAGARFLLAWTEGPVSSHQVRAQTLSVSGDALGLPMTISGEGVNAGQGQVAVLPDGHGLVAYMASPAGATAQVVAAPVTCPQSSP